MPRTLLYHVIFFQSDRGTSGTRHNIKGNTTRIEMFHRHKHSGRLNTSPPQLWSRPIAVFNRMNVQWLRDYKTCTKPYCIHTCGVGSWYNNNYTRCVQFLFSSYVNPMWACGTLSNPARSTANLINQKSVKCPAFV